MSDVKSITFLTLELVHQVGEFTVSEGDNGMGPPFSCCQGLTGKHKERE
jgi:hypothetical protein